MRWLLFMPQAANYLIRWSRTTGPFYLNFSDMPSGVTVQEYALSQWGIEGKDDPARWQNFIASSANREFVVFLDNCDCTTQSSDFVKRILASTVNVQVFYHSHENK
jgi:hypothetical protein